MVAHPARGQRNRENEPVPVPVRAEELGLAIQVRPSRPASARSLSTFRLNLIGWCLLAGFLPFSADGVHLFICTVNRHWASAEFIRSCNCVPMAFTAEILPPQGQ